MNVFIQKDPTGLLPIKDIASIDLVATCNWNIDPEMFGVAQEMVVKVYDDYAGLKLAYAEYAEGPLNIAYISVDEARDQLQYLLVVISFFNQLNSATLTICCSEESREILKDYSNEHIQFVDRSFNRDSNSEITANAIITYGSGAMHFIKQGMPTIIVGPFGLGGWVTPVNLHHLLREGFMGRPGGVYGEIIPLMIFTHELLTFKECKDIRSIIASNQHIVNGYSHKPLSEIEGIVDGWRALREQLNHSEKCWLLKPKVSSNICFHRNDNTVAVKRKCINDTLCTIEASDIPFFQAMDGINDCKAICQRFELAESDFWGMMFSLIKTRIILF